MINIQKWGTSTILIESGGLENDPEKQYIRKLNFVSILSALESIATNSFLQSSIEEYERIPFNESNDFHDLIIRQVQIPLNDNWYMVDLGIRRSEVPFNDHRNFYYSSRIQDIGDLSTFTGYEELDAANNYRAYFGRSYPDIVPDMAALKELDIISLLQRGYTNIQMQQPPPVEKADQLPLRITAVGESIEDSIEIGDNPSLLLVNRNGKVDYVVINGFLFNLQEDGERIKALIRFL